MSGWPAALAALFALVPLAAQADPKPPERVSPAPEPKLDFDAHLAELRKKLPPGFHVVVEPPFVVIGDEPKAAVARRAKRTVKWAVDLLKKAYFESDPDHIIDIWLFKDAESYRAHTEKLFAEEPDTPFGYYSAKHRALIMDISTGGGTLVHEIVHPFVRANFPGCPAWLNEGLGSLYEQCREEDGRIVGLTNWRLSGLQKAIRAGEVPTFRALTATTDREFYDEDPGTNYAQARYLCYWLQQKGKLRELWREFRANREDDPTGYATLKRVLGRDDMAAFQQEWERFVLGLRFR